MLRDEVKDLRLAYREREQDHKDLTDERVALTLRLEKSEANAIASNNEMLEVSRKAAREIASLRAKLAEKDAQLMGGFGIRLEHGAQGDARAAEATSMEPMPRSTPRRPEREVRDTSRPNRKQTRRRGGRRRRRTSRVSLENRSSRRREPEPKSPQTLPRDREAGPRERTRRRGRRARGPSGEGLARVRWVEVETRRVERRPAAAGSGGSHGGQTRGRPTTDGTRAGSHSGDGACHASSTVRNASRRIVYSACDFFSRRLGFTFTVPRPATRRRSHLSPHSAMTQLILGLLLGPHATFSSLRTTRSPSPRTRPNTTCLSSSHSVLAQVMKNWHPLESGPLLAMDRGPVRCAARQNPHPRTWCRRCSRTPCRSPSGSPRPGS